MRLIFFGSSAYCLPILDSLYNKVNLLAVVAKPKSIVQQYANRHNIIVLTPKDKKELLAIKNEIGKLQPDLAIVADYGLIIPEAIFDIPKYKTLNIHFSRLPDLRGPSPVQCTILRGDKSAWISIIIMAEEMDTGDIIWQKAVPLEGFETSESLYKKLFNIVSVELPDIIHQYVKKELKHQKQDHLKATYTKILTREDGFIPPQIINAALEGKIRSEVHLDKKASPSLLHCYIVTLLNSKPIALCIERAIRAFSPWPGVWTKVSMKQLNNETMNTKRLKILIAHLQPTTYNLQPTTKLIIDLVQLEGKNPVSWKQFKEGYPNFSL